MSANVDAFFQEITRSLGPDAVNPHRVSYKKLER